MYTHYWEVSWAITPGEHYRMKRGKSVSREKAVEDMNSFIDNLPPGTDFLNLVGSIEAGSFLFDPICDTCDDFWCEGC